MLDRAKGDAAMRMPKKEMTPPDFSQEEGAEREAECRRRKFVRPTREGNVRAFLLTQKVRALPPAPKGRGGMSA